MPFFLKIEIGCILLIRLDFLKSFSDKIGALKLTAGSGEELRNENSSQNYYRNNKSYGNARKNGYHIILFLYFLLIVCFGNINAVIVKGIRNKFCR